MNPVELELNRYLKMEDVDIGRLASGSYGREKQQQFFIDFREILKLAIASVKK